MPTDSPIKIESDILGTWKISETLNDEAIFQIGEFSESEITECTELQYDVFEIKIQGTLNYSPCGGFYHKTYLQISIVCEDSDLQLRYYIRYNGKWTYNKEHNEISESHTEFDVLCLDEETEEVTGECPEILEEFSSEAKIESCLIESINAKEMTLTDKRTGMKMRLSKVND